MIMHRIGIAKTDATRFNASTVRHSLNKNERKHDMPIEKMDGWNKCVENNTDPYGKCCVDVARKVMEILDAEPGEFDCHKLINRAGDEIDASGITGYMAGAVALMVGQVHSRGDEFRKQWNKGYGVDEDKAKGGTVNPAILTMKETP